MLLAALGASLAGTLATIAERGWVHLDVKPENIVVGSRPRLLDFNIALRAAEEYGGAMDKFDAMQMFVRLVEKGSFSAVARNVELANLPSASRSLPLRMNSAPS